MHEQLVPGPRVWTRELIVQTHTFFCAEDSGNPRTLDFGHCCYMKPGETGENGTFLHASLGAKHKVHMAQIAKQSKRESWLKIWLVLGKTSTWFQVPKKWRFFRSSECFLFVRILCESWLFVARIARALNYDVWRMLLECVYNRDNNYKGDLADKSKQANNQPSKIMLAALTLNPLDSLWILPCAL